MEQQQVGQRLVGCQHLHQEQQQQQGAQLKVRQQALPSCKQQQLLGQQATRAPGAQQQHPSAAAGWQQRMDGWGLAGALPRHLWVCLAGGMMMWT